MLNHFALTSAKQLHNSSTLGATPVVASVIGNLVQEYKIDSRAVLFQNKEKCELKKAPSHFTN